MSSPSGPRPAPARGTLDAVPVAQALVYLRNKRLTGTYELSSPDGRRARLVVWRGRIAHATTTPSVARFGAVAYELGLVDAATLDASTLESTRRRIPQLDVLLERGALTTEGRDRVLVEQVHRRGHHLFTFPDTAAFAFHEAAPARDEPPLAVDPLVGVWRGLSDFAPVARMRAVLERLGDVPLVMVSEAVLERAELAEPERALCEQLVAKPSTFAELVATSPLPRATLDRLVYLLVLAECVEPAGTRMSTSGTRSAVSGPAHRPASFRMPQVLDPRPTEGASTSLRALPTPEELGPAGVRARAARVGAESPYEALGVSPQMSAEAIRAAYFRLARQWSPDRLPPSLADVRAEVARVHAWLGVALRVLVDGSAAEG